MVDRLFQIVYLLIEKPKMTARELAEAFEVSPSGDKDAVGKVLTEGTRNYVNTKESIRVTLEISQEMAFRAYEELADVSVMDNGKLRCQMEINDKKWFTSYVLSYGSHMRILEPLEIKEYVRQEIESMKHLYEESNGR